MFRSANFTTNSERHRTPFKMVFERRPTKIKLACFNQVSVTRWKKMNVHADQIVFFNITLYPLGSKVWPAYRVAD